MVVPDIADRIRERCIDVMSIFHIDTSKYCFSEFEHEFSNEMGEFFSAEVSDRCGNLILFEGYVNKKNTVIVDQMNINYSC